MLTMALVRPYAGYLHSDKKSSNQLCITCGGTAKSLADLGSGSYFG
jgi:hypothetical protein